MTTIKKLWEEYEKICKEQQELTSKTMEHLKKAMEFNEQLECLKNKIDVEKTQAGNCEKQWQDLSCKKGKLACKLYPKLNNNHE